MIWLRGLALLFVVFVAVAALVSIRERRDPEPRAARDLVRVRAFLWITLVVSFAPMVLQVNFWPFARWQLVAGRVPDPVDFPKFRAVDARGAEHEIDWRAWQPMAVDELYAWAQGGLESLPEEGRERVLRYLLARAESGRARALRGERIGTYDRLLGPLAAPLFLLHPNYWSDPADVPAEPFVGLRYYRERWRVNERAADPGAFERVLAGEVFER